MNLKDIIIELLPSSEEYIELKKLVTETSDSSKGDYCVPCFSLAKTLHKSPMQIAEDLKQLVKPSEYVDKMESIAGYLNFYLNKEKISKIIIQEILEGKEDCFKSKVGEGKTICIDYSSVNLAKYMHIGHLKNTIIGESITRICEALGYNVVRLQRIRIMNIKLGELKKGQYRKATESEFNELYRMIRESKNQEIQE